MNMISIIRKKIKSEPIFDGSINTFINPYSYIFLRKSASTIDFNLYIDGIFLVIFLRLIGVKALRCSFDMTSLAPVVFQNAIYEKKSIYLLGSSNLDIENAKKFFTDTFMDLNIIGYRSGYFSNDHEMDDFLNELVVLSPDIVIVGMGAGLQEKVLINLKSKGWKGTGFTCGGFYHQTSKKGIEYYPFWVDRLNLRFLYRMYDEPKLIKRYFLYYPYFLILFIFDYILSINKR